MNLKRRKNMSARRVLTGTSLIILTDVYDAIATMEVNPSPWAWIKILIHAAICGLIFLEKSE